MTFAICFSDNPMLSAASTLAPAITGGPALITSFSIMVFIIITMHNYQRSSLGNYFTQNETGRYFSETAGSLLDAATFGLAGDLYKMAVDTDIETGGLISSA
jgi:hypothetical protein